jgi:hypothetical protein
MKLPTCVENLALLGWKIHPCYSGSRASCFIGANDQSTSDLDILGKWSREFPGCNWRVRMEGSGIFALDLDVPGGEHKHDGIAAMASLVSIHGILPRRPTIRTGGGGLVIFFRYNGEVIRGDAGCPLPGIDPRRGRLTVTIPPSSHHRTRKPYIWLTPPWEVSPPDCPPWLSSLLAPPPAQPYVDRDKTKSSPAADLIMSRALTAISRAQQGTRNACLNRWAFILALRVNAGELSESEACDGLMRAGAQAGMSIPESRATISSAFRGARRG